MCSTATASLSKTMSWTPRACLRFECRIGLDTFRPRPLSGGSLRCEGGDADAARALGDHIVRTMILRGLVVSHESVPSSGTTRRTPRAPRHPCAAATGLGRDHVCARPTIDELGVETGGSE